jgi:PKD repeat protein
MSNTKIPIHRRTGRIGLLALAPMMTLLSINANAAPASITATAKLDIKTNQVVVTGKTAATIDAGARISVYDVNEHIVLYSAMSDAKKAFKMNLLGTTTVPCMVRVEATNPKDNSLSQILLPVSGAPASCKTTQAPPACAILSPSTDTEVVDNSVVNFESAALKTNATYEWSFGDGSVNALLNKTSHLYTTPGKYRVTLKVSSGASRCLDETFVSVIPPKGTNPNPKVLESEAPKLGEAMPKADGSNDVNAYVVLPFEDMGMQGGSQIQIPYNNLVPYNALNAQVLQKIPHKPPLIEDTKVGVSYSAASNPKDPAAPLGTASINSTSQNLFDKNQVGANFDPKATAELATTTKETKYVDERSYSKALIAKTEFWDKIHQENASKITDATGKPLNLVEQGLSKADTENTFIGQALMLPDQGIRGQSDKGKEVRAMPGISNPYIDNKPQKLSYNSTLQSFIAQNIPATSTDDQGRVNPYPIMRVEAKVGNKVVAKTDAVYTTASETQCRSCHIRGQKGADHTVWRTPVTINELVNPDGSRGPATGEGAFPFPATYPKEIKLTGDAIADFKTYGYGPAVHQTFIGDTFVLNSKASMVAPGIKLEFDENGVRKDRVEESRWLKPDGSTSKTNPTKDPTWKIQIRLKFKDSKDFGEDTWQNQEKAARFNNMLMHDYMTPINYNNARDDIFADYAEDKFTTRNSVTMCASHHTSTLKADVGSGAYSQVKTLSDWTRTAHAFHGKMQVYKRDVSASESADKQAHKQGDLIRDERGHPKMLGGRGWDTINNDLNGLPYKIDPTTGGYTIKGTVYAFAERNNWRPDLFPAHKLGEEMLPVGENIPMEKNCLTCHTGNTEKSYRDIHATAGLKCDNCHGGMLAVGLTYPNELYNGNLTRPNLGVDDPKTLTAPDFRRAWIDEPDCGSCHMGDGNMGKGEKGTFSAGVLRNAWADGDKAAASIFPENARFAVMPTKEKRLEKATVDGKTTYLPEPVSQALYRKSADVHGTGPNGTLTCSTCHGGSHGIWPNQDPNANDNQTARQLQGYDGNIAECSVCHVKDDFKTGLVATDGGASGLGVGQGVRDGTVVDSKSDKAYLAGPHGMHPVGDESWYKNADGAAANTAKDASRNFNGGWHNDFAKKAGPDGEDQCAACHGADHKGTRLSKTLVDRTLMNAKGKPIKVIKGQVIGCDLCHTLAKSFTDSPKGEAKLHAPPKPELFTIQSTGGSSTTSGGSMGGMSH